MTPTSLLLRQVHPDFLQLGRPTSQVFRPTPKDEEKLSVYDGDMITAEASLEHYTKALGFESEGVLAVTVTECDGEELPVTSDPEPFPEHCVIDFSGLAKKVIERKAKALSKLANARDWQYRVPGASPVESPQPTAQ